MKRSERSHWLTLQGVSHVCIAVAVACFVVSIVLAFFGQPIGGFFTALSLPFLGVGTFVRLASHPDYRRPVPDLLDDPSRSGGSSGEPEHD